jgi:hypothetical protein
MDMKEFVKVNNITVNLTRANSNPNMDDNTMNHYKAVLHMDGRQMTTPFSTGSGWKHDPDAADILGSLVSDSSGYDSAGSFEDWANEYGYDTDSRKAERLYNAIGRESRKVKQFLADKYEYAIECEF